MKKFIVLLLLIMVTACSSVSAQAPDTDVYLPHVEDELLALPLDDHIQWVGDGWKDDNRYRIAVTVEFFELLKSIPNPVGFRGNIYKKVQWHYFTTNNAFEEAIWAEDGEGLWVTTDGWFRGVIHYR